MGKIWVANTTSRPRPIDGRMVLPGDGVFVDDGAALPRNPALTVIDEAGKDPVIEVDGQRYGLMPEAQAAQALALVSEGGIRSQQVAPATFANARLPLEDESLAIAPLGALDLSTWRTTATPAGSRGRVTVSGTKLHEAGVEVRFNVASWAPDTTFAPIPSDRAAVTAAAENLARQGYNGLRIHGVENWLMAGIDGAAIFNPARLDLFDFFLSELKRVGIFWVFNVQSYNLFLDMDGATNRFTYTEASSAKPRMYTEANIRANWTAGVSALLNRVNPYTGLNMLQDPAMLAVSVFNEQSTTFCAQVQFPSVWLTRTGGSTPAAQTWVEWLSDSAKSHGYANLAALNTAWGSAHASFAVAAAVTVPPFNTSFPSTRQAVDAVKYAQYLEDDLAAFFSAQITALGFPGITWWSEIYHTLLEGRGYGKYPINQVYAPHAYSTVINNGIADGSTMLAPQGNSPIWDYENAMLMPSLLNNNKPFVAAEYGWPAWCKYMAQFPVMAAVTRTHDSQYMTHFAQGDVFALDYFNDTTTHGNRLRRIEPYHCPGNVTNDFVRVMLAALMLRGDVSPMDVTKRQQILLNERHYGTNPVNTARPARSMFTLLQPLYFIAALRRAGVDWTDDTTDDALAATWNPKQLSTLASEAQAAGAIAADHPTLVSVTANSGNIAAIAFTGTVGGLTATQGSPVLTLTGNTLVTGDVIFISNITGASGTWPGTGLRNGPLTITKGTGDFVQITSASFAAASGALSAGTWSEGANVVVAGNLQWGWSRRTKQTWINTARTVFFSHVGASLPVTFGNVRIDALTTDASMFVTSLDGLDIGLSRKLLIGLAGDSQNTGMAFTDATRKTIAAGGGGDYPIQASDEAATLKVVQTAKGRPRVSALNRAGVKRAAPRSLLTDATGFVCTVRTADENSYFWLIEV